MTIRNAITAELLWGSLWRAGLYGVLLGTTFGGLYGAAGGTLIFPLLGTAIGLFFGALTGAVVGLPLGLLDGLLLLFWLATAYRYVALTNSCRYRLQARIVCVAGSLLALLIDWTRHGLPYPDGFCYRSCQPDGSRPVLADQRPGRRRVTRRYHPGRMGVHAYADDTRRLVADGEVRRRMVRGQGPTYPSS